MTQSTNKPFTNIGLVNQSKNWSITVIESDQRTPGRSATNISSGTINRIQHPRKACGTSLISGLFTNDSIMRSMRSQYGAHRLLCSLICLCDWVETRLKLIINQKSGGSKPLQCLHRRCICKLSSQCQNRFCGWGRMFHAAFFHKSPYLGPANPFGQASRIGQITRHLRRFKDFNIRSFPT